MTFLSPICLTCNPDVGAFSPIRVNCIRGIIFYVRLGSDYLDRASSIFEITSVTLTSECNLTCFVKHDVKKMVFKKNSNGLLPNGVLVWFEMILK